MKAVVGSWGYNLLIAEAARWPESLLRELSVARDGLDSWIGSQDLPDIGSDPGPWVAVLGPALLFTLLLVISSLLTLRRRRRQRSASTIAAASLAPAFMLPDSDAEGLAVPDQIRAYLMTGTILLVVLVGGAGGWAATTELAGAVLAPGTVVVDSKVKKVQHLTGGIVGEIRVKDGDVVKVGDVLLRLDETVTRANLEIVTKQLDELAVRKVRLMAELDGAGSVATPTELKGREDEASIVTIIASERALFESRRAARDGQKAQLEERIAQLKAEIEGMQGQISAKVGEVDLMTQELDRLLPLEKAHLVPITKMNDTRRELTRLKGEHAQLLSSLAQAKEKIAETELQITQLDDDMRSDAGKDLRELQGKEAELIERKVAAMDQLARVDIRAPQSGIVHQLAVHTIGGVVMAGDTIMLIVPEDDPLVIEAKVTPVDIDHVRTDQTAFVRFPAFNQRTTPELSGRVSLVAADLTRDTTPSSPNQPYYLARIVFTPEELAKLGGLKLISGMPAEVHIETPKRTALSYLIKPLTDQVELAFKER